MVRHVWKAAVVVALMSIMMTLEQGRAEAQGAQNVTLTCSFIRLQCLDECDDRGPRFFCRKYCRQMRSSCMSTGNWHGWFGDRFNGVTRE